MFCTQCGQQNKDGNAFCENCGTKLETASFTIPQSFGQFPQRPGNQTIPAGQQVSPVYTVPSSGQYTETTLPSASPGLSKPPKKSRTGLIVGLVSGFILLIVALIFLGLWLVPLLTGQKSAAQTSVIGLWSNLELGEVLEFKSSSVIIHNSSSDLKGTYNFDKAKSKGVITLENTDYSFKVTKDKVDVDEMGVYVKENAKDFDIDAFIEDADVTAAPSNTTALETSAPTDTPTVQPTVTPTPKPTAKPTPAVETVKDKTMTLKLAYGDRKGVYTGEVVKGLPEGTGSFTSVNSEGVSWTYEGKWKAGHCSGQGTTTWEGGYSETGVYKNDRLNGKGKNFWEGVLRYEGSYKNGVQNGAGTLYNSHSEIIFSGTFKMGFLQETTDDRNARVGAFKDQSISPSYAELYDGCQKKLSLRSKITGTVFFIYTEDVGDEYYCEFFIYEKGVEESGRIVSINYRLTEGEAPVKEGQKVTVWGTTEYLFSYTSDGGDDLTIPYISAWSVE